MATPSITHLTDVGRTKAMGLLLHREICDLGHSVQALRGRFNDASQYIVRKFDTGMQMWGDAVPSGGESLAVASIPMLQALLDDNKRMLERAGWPVKARDFFDRSFTDFVMRGDEPCGSEIQDLIKKAYRHGF